MGRNATMHWNKEETSAGRCGVTPLEGLGETSRLAYRRSRFPLTLGHKLINGISLGPER